MTGASIAAICFGAFITCVVTTFAAECLAKLRFPLPATTGRFGCVDGLRGYLAMFVMLYHFILFIEVTRLGAVWSRPSLSFFDSLGPGSVNLFFMTTGFLFYPRVMNGFPTVDWGSLYISRVFRIVPLVLFLVVAASVLTLVRMDFRPTQPFTATAVSMVRWIVCWDQPDLWGYRDSGKLASVLWSLWFEWLFYLFVLPACAVAMSLRGRAPRWRVPAGLIALSIGLKSFHLAPLIDFLPLFGIGMLAYELRSRPAISEALATPLASAIALTCFVAGTVVPSGPARILLHGTFFVCVACGCSLWGILRTRGARLMGEVSYGVYVLHMLVLNVLFVSFTGTLGRFSTAGLPTLMPIAALGVLTFAATAFLFVERPGIRLGKAIALKLQTLKLARSRACASTRSQTEHAI